ncbi:ParB/RepB/Spo0J family partition protein [Clostridium sp. AF32-12BH]|uniref:ParB/RepB/Spo0J family partition protein n=1 Tax=Clostridium sp. AF32-12BH TaxID=2292006 RepID=UPI0015F91313
MAGARRGLGRGLGALFGEDTVEEVIGAEKAEKAIKTEKAERAIKTEKAAKTEKTEKAAKTAKSEKIRKAENRENAAGSANREEAAGPEHKKESFHAKGNSSLKQNEKTEKDDTAAMDSVQILGDAVNTAALAKNGQQEEPAQTELELKVSELEPNRDQPRKAFDEVQLEELADSIRKYGVLQPLLVQKKKDNYEIIAGERRWRAAKLAGLKTVPVVIREYSPQQAMEIALIENVQREDLNPIEEALAYQRLMQEFSLKQEEIAERVSKNRTTITNSMRLLNLTPEVQKMLVEGRISSGHARALLALSDPQQQIELAKKVELERMSVREIEKAVKLLGKEKKEKKKKEVDEAVELVFQNMENRMKTVMGTKVNISRKDKTKGKIEIEYYSEAELERIVELIESIQPM